MTSTPRSSRSVVDEETIFGGPQVGEDVPDYVYEDFEESLAGGGRMGDAP